MGRWVGQLVGGEQKRWGDEGEEGDNIVLLLCGGDKSSQTQDIEAAKAYWKEHLNHA